jgi:tetratricopeptide (TPR) repeat protein
MSDVKPVIFISYSHKDEPEHPRDGETQWLSFVRTYLQPAVKHGVFDLWVDQNMPGGTDWDPEIEQRLRACDIFILLVSANSMASGYIIDKEIAIIRDRQVKGEDVYFYPLLLTPTPDAGLDKVKDKNLRPRDAQPFSGFSYHDRLKHMTEAANEIASFAEAVIQRKGTRQPQSSFARPTYVHTTGLPETAYERLVGRAAELKRLDGAWTDRNTNILSLIAEGGAGKSALVNEWLKRMQAENYRGAEAVLGWSFYSQGTKERATSAEQFLNWGLDKLGIKIETTSATAKGEAIAEVMLKRRVLLVLDGCEPLQHGLDKQQGELKDQGLRALLRRFASMPPSEAHGLVVLTSRLPVKDIARWKESAAPVKSVDKLSDQTGAALLRDNRVWGTDKELQAAARDFDGHPLALGLLASFLNETQFGDVRRRDYIRAFFADAENPRHDHARRVMESYEKEWLAEQPVLLAIMHMIGLFDRPASGDCLNALRAMPAIEEFTDHLVKLDDGEWQRACARLREARLLAPPDPAAPAVLDAHPLVREWFGDALRQTKTLAWQAAHSRLYDHLCLTKEGNRPTLEQLGPIYQAIDHGCHANRHREALENIYRGRICRWDGGKLLHYAGRVLGAYASNLAAISRFFETPYIAVVQTLRKVDRDWVLAEAAFSLRAQGRFSEAVTLQRISLQNTVAANSWNSAAFRACNLSEMYLALGDVALAIDAAEKSVEYARRAESKARLQLNLTTLAESLVAAGNLESAKLLYTNAEAMLQTLFQPGSLLYSVQGYAYSDLLITKGEFAQVWNRGQKNLDINFDFESRLNKALTRLALGRSGHGMEISGTPQHSALPPGFSNIQEIIGQAVDYLQLTGRVDHIPRGFLARAAFRRSVGNWDGAARDLDEVEEIAETGPMKLHLCDMALERVRLAVAEIEAFAPLNGLVDDSPPKPVAPDTAEAALLKEEAAKQLATAADHIKICGYHRRDEELAELDAVLRGERKFADLPPRV